jgi:hypothetical protein
MFCYWLKGRKNVNPGRDSNFPCNMGENLFNPSIIHHCIE